MADILSQQQTEKEIIKEAAAKRSLQEIQEEQAFQEWWDEEIRKARAEVEEANDAKPTGRGRRGIRGIGRGPSRVRGKGRGRGRGGEVGQGTSASANTNAGVSARAGKKGVHSGQSRARER